jgi:hypothetical protein
MTRVLKQGLAAVALTGALIGGGAAIAHAQTSGSSGSSGSSSSSSGSSSSGSSPTAPSGGSSSGAQGNCPNM